MPVYYFIKISHQTNPHSFCSYLSFFLKKGATKKWAVKTSWVMTQR